MFKRLISFVRKLLCGTKQELGTASIAEKARKWVSENPAAQDEMSKAFYAWHATRGEHEYAHAFEGSGRNSSCLSCGRTREQVRYDEHQGECIPVNYWDSMREKSQEIADVIRREEVKYLAKCARAAVEIPKFLEQRGISGETLAFLKLTHGYDIDECSAVVCGSPRPAAAFTTDVIEEYEAILEGHSALSKSRAVRDVITVSAT